jgi:hypothetical protein
MAGNQPRRYKVATMRPPSRSPFGLPPHPAWQAINHQEVLRGACGAPAFKNSIWCSMPFGGDQKCALEATILAATIHHLAASPAHLLGMSSARCCNQAKYNYLLAKEVLLHIL